MDRVYSQTSFREIHAHYIDSVCSPLIDAVVGSEVASSRANLAAYFHKQATLAAVLDPISERNLRKDYM